MLINRINHSQDLNLQSKASFTGMRMINRSHLSYIAEGASAGAAALSVSTLMQSLMPSQKALACLAGIVVGSSGLILQKVKLLFQK